MSLTKIGSIGINTGIQLAGVTTVATLHVGSGVTLSSDGDIFATGISTFSEDIKVGSGVTISPDGDGFYTGVVTATTFSGSLAASNLTGALPAISGASLTGIDTDLVSDTSPQLGGNLDVNTKNIVFGDSGSASDDRLTFGAGTDLSVYHDGSHSRIVDSGTGNLILQTSKININNADGTEAIIHGTAGGAVEVYHANSVKLNTTSSGVSITGNATISGAINTSDNQNINVGNGGDLKIFHDGTDSFIHGTTSTRQLKIRGQEIRVVNEANSEIMAKFIEDGAVELYHDNIKKLQTSTTDGVILGNTTDDANYTNTLTLTRRGYENSGYGVRIQAKGGSAAGQNGLRFAISDGGGSTYNSRFSFTNDGLLFNSDTAAANALDDYEEGTFTPSVSSGLSAGQIAYNSRSGKYTKVGNTVTLTFHMNISSATLDSGALKFGNFPFTSANVSHTAGGMWRIFTTGNISSDVSYKIIGNSTDVQVISHAGDAVAANSTTINQGNRQFAYWGFYYIS